MKKIKEIAGIAVILVLIGIVVVSIVVAIYRLSQPLKDLSEEFDGYDCKDANLFFSKNAFQSAVGQIK